MPVVRLFDINSGGGMVVQSHRKVSVNFRPMGKYLSLVTPHFPCPFPPIHCIAIAAFPGSKKVTVQNVPVLRVGDRDTCGHSRATGSRNVVCG